MGNVKIGDWLSEAWTIISEDLVTHILLALIVWLGTGITGGLLSGPLMGGYLWIVFKKMKDPSYTPQVGDIAKGFENFVQLLLVGIVAGIIASVGVIACGVGVFFTSALVILALPLVVGLLNALGGAVAIGFLITLPIMVVALAIGYRAVYGLSGGAPAAAGYVAPTPEPPMAPPGPGTGV